MSKEIVCHCYDISKEDIEIHIKNGVKTFKELQQLTKIGNECEPCFKTSKVVFDQIIKNT